MRPVKFIAEVHFEPKAEDDADDIDYTADQQIEKSASQSELVFVADIAYHSTVLLDIARAVRTFDSVN